MTVQFHVVYSDLFVGAGIIAGGPYYCSGSYESNLQRPFRIIQKAVGISGDIRDLNLM